MAQTIAATDGPKAYLTNSDNDPESIGLDFTSQIEKFITCLKLDAAATAAPHDLLQLQ